MRKKFLAGLLALVMLLSLVPVSAIAAEGDTASDNDALHLAKTTTLQSDGTYTIKLEAYATGTVTTSTESVPCDIVLLLDQSGSMNDALGTMQTTSFKKVSIPTWTAIYISQFINTLWRENPVGSGQYEQVYLERTDSQYTLYDSDGNVIESTETGLGAVFGVPNTTIYTYSTSTSETSKQQGLQTAAVNFVKATAEKNAVLAADQQHRIAIVKFADDSYASFEPGDDKNSDGYNYTQIVASMTAVNSETVDGLVSSINGLEAAGATSADYGMNKAIQALGNLSTGDGRKKIIVLFTDGEPNHSNGFSTTVANSTVSASKTVKDQGVIVYTIGVLADADPTQDPTLSTSDNFNKYLHAVSSNYPEATSITALGSKGSYTDGYYKTASTTDELNSIFQEIQNSVGSTTITLDETAVMKDIVTDNFILPEGFTAADNVKVETVNYAGDGKFNEDTRTLFPSAVVTINGRTVDVKGFDYAENYCVDGSGTVATSGKKLRVTISGVELNPDQFADGVVNTNAATSGIYDGDGNEAVLVEAFDVPTVKLASKSYVIDYAKSFTMDASEWGIQTLRHMGLTPAKFTSANTGGLDLINGVLNKLTYTPQTMSWNGYDTFYGFGVPTSDQSDVDNPYIWSKVNVIPANNVYYEDSFKDATSGGEAGTVGIVYTGSWNEEGTASGNAEDANGPIAGWVAGLGDDSTYSDGSAHEVSYDGSNAATAKFTFTGTGVDVYSRTNLNSGKVFAFLRKVGDDGTETNKQMLLVDNLAVSGDYYNVPTLTFQDLDYGTYSVEIVVNRAYAVDSNGEIVDETTYRSTYYLDGIRVYNPLGSVSDVDTKIDATVSDAYNGQIETVFKEVRDLLNNADNTDDTTNGNVVFVDYNPDKLDVAYEARVYEETDVYNNYGPKNEVYLAPGQSIVFKVDGAENYYIGLKSLKGDACSVNAAFSYGEDQAVTSISHTTDLYYKVTPSEEGYVTVTNKSIDAEGEAEPILAVTKLQMTSGVQPAVMSLRTVSDEEAVAEVAAFSLRSTVAYSAPAVEEVPEETTPEEAIPEETIPKESTPTDPEVPDIDIDIQNPTEPEQKPAQNETLKNLVKNLFNKILGWFGR